MKSNLLRGLVYFVCIGIVVSICLFLVFDLPQFYRASKTKEWPVTDATIVESSLYSKKCSSPVISGLVTIQHTPHIEFDYAVGSKKLRSSRITAGGWGDADCQAFMGEAECQSLLTRFPKGSMAKAYYNPAEPSYAVLMPGVDQLQIVSPCLAIGMPFTLLLAANLWIFLGTARLIKQHPLLSIAASIAVTLCSICFSVLLLPYLGAATGVSLPRLLIPHQWLSGL
jgi:hypothetical protein